MSRRRASRGERPGEVLTRPAPGAAYAACAWAVLFAAVSGYWAAGGLGAIDTIGGSLEERGRAGDADFVAQLWAITAVKLLGGGFALALARRWDRVPVRLTLFWAGAVAGLLMAFYGAALIVQHGLMEAGAVDPGDLDDTAIRGHLLIWDPVWLAGGVLFLLTALRFRAAWRERL